MTAAAHEQVLNLPIDRGELPAPARRIETPHHLLSHPRLFARILRLVVQPLVLLVLHVLQFDFVVGRLVAEKLDGHVSTRWFPATPVRIETVCSRHTGAPGRHRVLV